MSDIIVPILIPEEPSVCPECGKPEDIVNACRHCGYIYEDEDSPPLRAQIIGEIIAFAIIAALFIWIIFTIGDWLAGGTPLLDVFKDQWEWLKSVRFK